MSAPPLSPGAVVGILGGGQLGRMLAMAAARLGLETHIYSPDPQSCAFDVVRRTTLADYGDEAALDAFAREVDVVTYEFENVPAETATFLSARKPVLPDPKVLATTQDRLTEKEFVKGLGIYDRTVLYEEIGSLDAEPVTFVGVAGDGDVRRAVHERFGYDLLHSMAVGATRWRF